MYKEFKSILNRVRTILIVPPAAQTIDSAVSVALLYHLFKDLLNKKTAILVPRGYTYSPRMAESVGYNSFPEGSFVERVLPLTYTITVPDVEKECVVEHKFVEDGLKVIIKPKKGKIDLEKSLFSAEGDRFDIVVAVGVQSKEMLNDAYKDSEEAISSVDIINIDHHPGNAKFGALNLVDSTVSTTTEVVVKIFGSLGVKFEDEFRLMALKSIVLETDGLRRISSVETIKTAAFLGGNGDMGLKEIIEEYYLSFNKVGLKLRKEMFERVNLDPSGQCMWCVLPKRVQDKISLSSGVLEGIDHLPFNICKGVKSAFLVYEVEPNQWKVVGIANDRNVNLFKLFKSLGGKGVAWYGVAEMSGEEEIVVKTVLKAIGEELFKGNFPVEDLTQKNEEKEESKAASPEQSVVRQGAAKQKRSDETEMSKSSNPEGYKPQKVSESIVDSQSIVKSPFKKTDPSELEKFAAENSPQLPSASSFGSGSMTGDGFNKSPFVPAPELFSE
uniref:DDH domain-containing protein n=1 Tax=candidate division CPR3 bacterium TaxID=2268181 RepID=A0A7C5UWG4_UNCC3